MLSAAAVFGLAIQCAVTVHPDTTLDIVKNETSNRPLAIGIVGRKSVYPRSIDEAMAVIKKLKAEGANYSVGLTQINHSNFSRYGVTEREMLDPCKNLSVYEKILSDCYVRGKTLVRALSCYYSGNFETGLKPEKAFNQTSYIQRMGYQPKKAGYVVPSTREGLASSQQSPTQQPTEAPPQYETWDVLREYPRPTPGIAPAQKPQPKEETQDKSGSNAKTS